VLVATHADLQHVLLLRVEIALDESELAVVGLRGPAIERRRADAVEVDVGPAAIRTGRVTVIDLAGPEGAADRAASAMPNAMSTATNGPSVQAFIFFSSRPLPRLGYC
jgi:hypothetical protein